MLSGTLWSSAEGDAGLKPVSAEGLSQARVRRLVVGDVGALLSVCDGAADVSDDVLEGVEDHEVDVRLSELMESASGDDRPDDEQLDDTIVEVSGLAGVAAACSSSPG